MVDDFAQTNNVDSVGHIVNLFIFRAAPQNASVISWPSCQRRSMKHMKAPWERLMRQIGNLPTECSSVLPSLPGLRAKELAGFLAFDFSEGPIPKFREDWGLEDPLQAVLSTCSTLISLVNADDSNDSPFVHFSPLSVPEFLTSTRLAENCNTITRRYHVSMTPSQALVAQACLGMLLHLDKSISKDSLTKFPLAEYAAEYWVDHARFEGVSQYAEEGMKQLFDASKPHFAIWLWIYDPIRRQCHMYDPVQREFQEPEKERTEKPLPPLGNPIHYAAFCGLHTAVKFLIIARSQDVHSRGLNDNSTPLHLASIKGHVQVTRFLVEHGADATARAKHEETPLHRASQGGHVDLAHFLVEHGADTTARDAAGWTPLHHASQQDSGNVNFARFLVENGADAMAQDEHGETPLHQASLNGHLDFARFLVERGADVTVQGEHVGTPLHQASQYCRTDLARFLVERGADVRARDKYGQTPLHTAAFRGRLDLARFLIEHGADATVRDKNRCTLLQGAARNPNVDVARFFVEHGTDATAPDEDGWTPLHGASEFGNLAVARFLVDHGADVTAQDKNGTTPLHEAS